jgi:probable F420-dependent oxidoreductase
LRIGISAYNMTGPQLVDLAVAAEEGGFGSLWLGEHVLLPVHYSTEHPTDDEEGQPELSRPIIDPETVLVDPLVTMAALAALTTRIELGTAVYLLTLRHPFITARAAATVQELSGGRFLLGVGAGWLKEEFESLGIPFARRFSRFDEAVEVLRLSMEGGAFEHSGQWYRTDGPVQILRRSCPLPIVFGGNTDRALDRAARSADGWFASGTPTLEEFLRLRDRLEGFRAAHGRNGPFRYWVRVNTWDPDALDRYRAEGVDEVLVWATSPYVSSERDELWPPGTLPERRARLAEIATALQLRVTHGPDRSRPS